MFGFHVGCLPFACLKFVKRCNFNFQFSASCLLNCLLMFLLWGPQRAYHCARTPLHAFPVVMVTGVLRPSLVFGATVAADLTHIIYLLFIHCAIFGTFEVSSVFN